MTMHVDPHNEPLVNALPLHGLRFAPPQVWGGVRLVPLLRDEIRTDLRLSRRAYAEDLAVVSVDPRTQYVAFVPHGLVANWTTDGGAVFGTQVDGRTKRKDGETFGGILTARGLKKMARREGKHQLRFLPQHVAMEGFLALHFGGPPIAWSEYSRAAIRTGLSPRSESVVLGNCISGLEDALRIFEIHELQVGVLVFVGDALASAFVVPHPDDYSALHHTLLTDFYGELLWHYGMYAMETAVTPEGISEASVNTLDDLRAELSHLRARWSALHASMASGLLHCSIEVERVYRFRPFTLNRFLTELDPKAENHIGESIYADDGTLQYLKTYRLSAAQCRRAYLIKQLASNDWSLDRCAESFGCRTSELILRLENAGFGYLLHQHVLDGARSKEGARSRNM